MGAFPVKLRCPRLYGSNLPEGLLRASLSMGDYTTKWITSFGMAAESRGEIYRPTLPRMADETQRYTTLAARIA
jgi:hypothetical protein